ncbi:4-hydroxy-tetrahydrodipicolinate synthase [Paenibacillus lignilyticus]|uniref:4-hydroxy-tetrahydrodipicolinate synthase n=1 Tax=Paenibacillus lignilyticus TaxID=1172615 RepID=A0ABS5CD73_9BACL|nr:4-hydroxy-tetrahydrodipicolinate synthase [Paenibacillus lignilyticus]MBP3963873.1 4-hydroxy-tetrahydrodipicolinate synthase [Paenibacillus lignilyticus]
MLNERDLTGTFVPIITPFLPTEDLDLESYQRYLANLLQYNIQGLVINGTTGEAPTVTWEEVIMLVAATKQTMTSCNRELPIIVGTGTNSTRSTIQRTVLAAELGADAVLVVTPYYSRPSQDGVLEHFRRAADVGIPVIVYEVPARTGLQLTPETVRSILDLQGVIGLKDSTSNTQLLTRLVQSDTKPILCGNDQSYLDMLAHGASGGILASANVRTELFVQLFQHVTQGEMTEAQHLFNSLSPLIHALFQESNPAPLKWVLAEQGLLDSASLRLPMSPISAELTEQLHSLLRS